MQVMSIFSKLSRLLNYRKHMILKEDIGPWVWTCGTHVLENGELVTQTIVDLISPQKIDNNPKTTQLLTPNCPILASILSSSMWTVFVCILFLTIYLYAINQPVLIAPLGEFWAWFANQMELLDTISPSYTCLRPISIRYPIKQS